MAVARREFEEETSFNLASELISLAEIKQPTGKVVTAWTVDGDYPAAEVRSNCFSMEWPPKSGKMHEFPEIDRAEWFSIEEARRRIAKGQTGFLDRLAEMLRYPPNQSAQQER
jgi:predicted NUDIX family NTP pyrophosphohydrolase